MANERPGSGANGVERNVLCANCGGHVDVRRWYPIVTRVRDGEVELYSFCGDDCRGEWERDRVER